MTAIPFAFPLANGLHARPASLLQEACLRFAAAVIFRNRRNRRRADGKSVLELVGSSTIAGDPCSLEVSGPQEKEAAQALRAFLQHDLPHADDAQPAAAVVAGGSGWLPPVFHDKASPLLRGRPLAPGTGQAVALRLERTRQLPRRFAAGKKDPRLERRLFRAALEKTRDGLRQQAEQAADPVGAGILKAQLAILCDPRFWRRIERLISRDRMPAGAAVKKAAAAFAAVLRRAPSAYLQERAGDLDDIAALLGEHLYGSAEPAAARSPRRAFIGVAAALSPAALLALDRRLLRGLALGEVGFTAHVSILARSLGIPAVALPAAALSSLRDGAEVIVDGRRGLVAAAPGAALKRYYRLEREAAGRMRLRRAGLTEHPAKTRDGQRVELAANVGSAAELEPAWQKGAEAIGLFRSEMLFLDREAPPGEDEQYAVYSQAARAARGRPVIIRTLDAGGDKNIPYLGLPGEANPMLGYRAVRFYGEHRELIRCQLRAMLRAARCGRLQVMVPMVTTVQEVRRVRALLAEAASELGARKVPHARRIELGIMVETPAAALAVDTLAKEADFFSVGSNDLLQYTMAVDRGNPALAGLFDPLQPSFLRLLQQAAGQARRARRWLGLCGEMAGNREYLPLLVGIGFDELSMAPGSIPAVKERLAQLDQGECRALLRRALRCADAVEVSALLREFNGSGGAAEVVAPELIRLDSASRTPTEAIKELCDMLELGDRVADASVLEEAVWKREETTATDLGFGFALPHGKLAAVRTASIAFLRPARPMRWSGRMGPPVRGVLLIAIPEQGGEEHLRLIARLSRQLMHQDFREALLSARSAAAVLRALRQCLGE
jgi:phosphoenolpyruvate-protein phosphotransferase